MCQAGRIQLQMLCHGTALSFFALYSHRPQPPHSHPGSPGATAARPYPQLDLPALEDLAQGLFERGLAKASVRAYASGKSRYLRFCELYSLPPLPVSERVACLFVAFLVHQGLKAQSIDVYLSAVRHLQVVAGLPPMLRNQWPRRQYLLRGV